jgi:hypothetical protein|tara:strand:- start:559 stop:771 length:213 start_codon:yes stop_codon:yes gene_type:complete
MLSKQSIRGTVKIYMNKELITDKEVLINESESWAEEEVIFFKKMIKQGGKFSVGGRKYFIIPNDDNRSLV